MTYFAMGLLLFLLKVPAGVLLFLFLAGVFIVIELYEQFTMDCEL
jgi:hypothetical protein